MAALGVATRVDALGLAPVMAFGAVLGPFVGQNWGAERIDRVWRAVRGSQLAALAWGVLVWLLLLLFGLLIGALFSDEPKIASIASTYLSIVPVGYNTIGATVLSNTSINTLNRPLHAAALTILQMLLLYVPLAHLG